jgi:nucleotide-binding universal stress UspA family protein
MVLLHVVEKLPAGAQHKLDLILGKDGAAQLMAAQSENVRQLLMGKRGEDDVIRKAFVDFHLPPSVMEPTPTLDAYDVVVEEGLVADTILKVSEEHKCGLVVMGSHSGILGRTTIGSVARAVLHGSKIPVLVVPPAPTP